MPYLIAILFIVFSFESASAQCRQDESRISQFIQLTERELCVSDGLCDGDGTFVVIDGSDVMSSQSKEWLEDNIFKGKFTHFDHEGGQFIAVYMGGAAIANLPMRSVYYPKPKEQVNRLFESPAKNKAYHAAYDCAVESIKRTMLYETTETGKSLLVETIKEIFTNPRYRQVSLGGKRKFVIASDFYQNSELIEFHKLCRRKLSGERICPTYNDLLKRSDRIAKYLKALTPKMRSTDEVYLYNINVDGKIDQSARAFWYGYFEAAGVPRKNIHYEFEPDQYRGS